MPDKHYIFDTVSLANFLLTDTASMVTRRYGGRASITMQVLDELTSGMRTHIRLKQVELLLAQNHFALISLTPSEYTFYTGLIINLGKGEASCIAAASVRDAVVVTDDRAARNRCVESGIACTGTIGILKAACIDKQISALDADRVLHAMIENGFFSPVGRISDVL